MSKVEHELDYFSEDCAMSCLAELLASACGVRPAMTQNIRAAAALHDIGKSQIDTAIITKPGKLTAREFEIIKTHTFLGAQILRDIKGAFGKIARNVAMYHHEWYDGNGYWGKKAHELPRYVQMAAICDVFIALISERPYKRAWSQEEALVYIEGKSGTQFEPDLVNIFLPLVQENQTAQEVLAMLEINNSG
jgi:putative two-component system response regulator